MKNEQLLRDQIGSGIALYCDGTFKLVKDDNWIQYKLGTAAIVKPTSVTGKAVHSYRPLVMALMYHESSAQYKELLKSFIWAG